MSNHHHEGDSKSFILPGFLAFALVFSLLILMAQCHGPYEPAKAAHGEHATEQHGTQHATEHSTNDSTHHQTDTTTHKTETHEEAHH
jgi:hypothetical protein